MLTIFLVPGISFLLALIIRSFFKKASTLTFEQTDNKLIVSYNLSNALKWTIYSAIAVINIAWLVMLMTNNTKGHYLIIGLTSVIVLLLFLFWWETKTDPVIFQVALNKNEFRHLGKTISADSIIRIELEAITGYENDSYSFVYVRKDGKKRDILASFIALHEYRQMGNTLADFLKIDYVEIFDVRILKHTKDVRNNCLITTSVS
jgi:hypothetical protein